MKRESLDESAQQLKLLSSGSIQWFHDGEAGAGEAVYSLLAGARAHLLKFELKSCGYEDDLIERMNITSGAYLVE